MKPILFFILFFSLIVFYMIYSGLSGLLIKLTLVCIGSGKVWSLELNMLNSSRVVVEFTHSVHLSREVDVLAVTSRGFYLVSTYAEDLGAGVPSSPSELGGGWTVPGSAIIYQDVWIYRGQALLFDLANAYNMTVHVGAIAVDSTKCSRLVVSAGLNKLVSKILDVLLARG